MPPLSLDVSPAMKNNQPVTQREYPLQEGEQLMSTTDLKGMITDANDAFIVASGFSREELIGNPHNMVRHPDMPGTAFADLWSHLRAGKAWMGLIKNRRKNGDHYYVNAHVTPIFDGDQIIGYQSVRTLPSREVVARSEVLYARLRKGGLGSLDKLLPRHWSYSHKSWIVALLVSVPALAGALLGGNWIVAAATFVVAAVLCRLLVQPLLALAERSRELFDDKLA